MLSNVGLNIFLLIPNYFSSSSASAVAIRQANTVNTIFGLTSTKSSGRAYVVAPIFRATLSAYLAFSCFS